MSDSSGKHDSNKKPINHLGLESNNEWLFRHGHSPKYNRSPTYKTWTSMRKRCSDKENKNYGGAGISVCDRWDSFENFLQDMGERPDNCTIDRIDPDGDYEPGNCRWADNKTQALNRKSTKLVNINGEYDSLNNFAKKYGVAQTTIYRRYSQGVRGDELISKENRNKLNRGENASGSKLSLVQVKEIKSQLSDGVRVCELSKKYNVSSVTISNIKSGSIWDLENFPEILYSTPTK